MLATAVSTSQGRSAVGQPLAQRLAVTHQGGQLDVDPGLQGQAGGLGLIGGDVMVAEQILDGEIVGDQRALEANLAAQQVTEQLARRPAGDAVQLVVAVHDRRQPGFIDGRLEGGGIDFAQLALRDVRRRPVEAAFRRAIPGEVLAGGGHAVRQVPGLQTAHVSRADLADQVRVFAVGLFGAPPARIADHVQHRSQGLARAHGQQLPRIS